MDEEGRIGKNRGDRSSLDLISSFDCIHSLTHGSGDFTLNNATTLDNGRAGDNYVCRGFYNFTDDALLVLYKVLTGSGGTSYYSALVGANSWFFSYVPIEIVAGTSNGSAAGTIVLGLKAKAIQNDSGPVKVL